MICTNFYLKSFIPTCNQWAVLRGFQAYDSARWRLDQTPDSEILMAFYKLTQFDFYKRAFRSAIKNPTIPVPGTPPPLPTSTFALYIN